MQDRKDSLTIAEFALRHSLSEATVRRYVRSGALEHHQPGGRKHRIIIPHDALDSCPPAKRSAGTPTQNENQTGSPREARGSRPHWMRRRPRPPGSELGRDLTDG